MTPERWRQLEELYDAVKDLTLEERGSRLYGVDAELRSAVSAIIAQEGTALEHPAWEEHANLVQTTTVVTPAWSPDRQDLPATTVGAGELFSARFLPGAIVAGRYRIVNLLGRGGMGEVYRAMDLTLGQTLALKFLPEGLSAQPLARERLLNEVRVAREITHPQVCRVHDVGEMDGQLYISMEFVDGEDLASLLARIGRLPTPKASELAAGICAGLAAAHRRGLVHRDLKPANIMVDGRGQPRLMDFGLTASVGKIARTEIGFGTPLYMAPEQLEGKEVTLRSDLYALGLIIYELFTGQRPFVGDSLEALMMARGADVRRPMSTLCPEVPDTVEAVVNECLSLDPARRPASAYAVAAALPYRDALTAVLAAGDTPSPELIAASGDAKMVRPFVAYGAAAAILLGLAGLYGLKAGGGAEMESPEVLTNKVQALEQQLGYAKQPAINYGFVRAGTLAAPEVRFWYRESETELEPIAVGNFIGAPGRVTSSDPPLQPGMRVTEMDGKGRLIRFLAIPQSPPASNAPVDWKVLFDSAGLNRSRFADAPAVTPPVGADAVFRWIDASPGERHEVRAASWMGQALYFEVTGAGSASAFPFFRRIVPAGTLMLIGILAAAFFFARRNVVRQRGDRKGAFRIGAAMFWVCACEWLLVGRHSFSLRETVLASFALSWALTMGVLAGVGYLAIDPMLRRVFPDALISLQQVLRGGRRDVLLGRDILFGLGVGVLFTLLRTTGPFGAAHQTYEYSTPRLLAGVWLDDLRLGLWVGLFWLAMLTPVFALAGKRHMRFGALGVVIAETVMFCLNDMPAVHDISSWYAQAPLLGYAAVVWLAIYGARLAAG